MTSSAPEPHAWKVQRWIAAVTSIFLLQFFFIYFLSARGPGLAHSPATPFLLELASAQWPEEKFSEVFLDSDPSLFALPGTHGFSGAAWLKDPVRTYEARSLFEQKEPPFWLDLNPGQLGKSLNQFVRTNTAGPVLRTEDSAPNIQTRLLDPPNGTKTNSQLLIEGELGARRLVSSQELVSWPHTNILSETEVRVAVNQNGMVISMRLLKKSGSEKADRSAMDAARQLQFAPDQRPMVWGDLIFDWHTLSVEGTNARPQPKSP